MHDYYRITDGHSLALGATLTEQGCNFAVHCPNAEQVYLCLFEEHTERQVACIPLQAKTGKVWHGFVQGVQAGQRYGYRTQGAYNPEMGLLFDYEKLLIDPYAKAISREMTWDEGCYASDSQNMVPKSMVVQADQSTPAACEEDFAIDELIIYETHVKGLTEQHPNVPPSQRGKYLGVSHPALIAHYKKLGVTAIQLMPVFAYMPEPFICEKGLTNYWGYNPINFFSPEPRYANDNSIDEFKGMVNALHQAGLKVILDVVYNHTAESGADGPVLSFKGMDNRGCYLFSPNEMGGIDFTQYENNSGCGNSLHTANPFMFTLIMDSLRYWVKEMGVDGFRFDLAASLGREPYEFSPTAGILRAIRQDPSLKNCILIAEPWDIGHGGYRLGQFPSHWLEVNDRYRDHVRGFWRGDKGMTGDFATRLLGSRDIFSKSQRALHSSVNHITYHDGFTLEDLVSYNERHNDDNLEQNRDGHQHNLSNNNGVEGPSNNAQITQLRQRQKRNLMMTLMLSQGVPHLLGGDEIGRTQKGNNNAYCQDNPISWYDWQLNNEQLAFFEFCCFIIRLRQSSSILKYAMLKDDEYTLGQNVEKIVWYRPDGCRKVIDDWHDPDNQAFAVELVGVKNTQEHWLILMNASEHDVLFTLPTSQTSQQWKCVVDTDDPNSHCVPKGRFSGAYQLQQQSVCLFSAVMS
jgi:glycogen operon protein